MLYVTISTINAVSAEKYEIDKGTMKYNDKKDIIKWNTQHNTKTNQIDVKLKMGNYDKKSKKYSYNVEYDTSLKKISKTKLEIVQKDIGNKQGIKIYKKTNLSSKSYYWKVYKPTMINHFKKIKETHTVKNYGASYSSDSNRTFWIHTYDKGNFFKPAHWTSPNGFAFTDKAWKLTFFAKYSISFYDINGKKISDATGTMTSSSEDQLVNIPDNAVKMKINVYGDDHIGSKSSGNYEIDAVNGSMTFDGSIGVKNFHLETLNYNSGYIKLKIYSQPFPEVGLFSSPHNTNIKSTNETEPTNKISKNSVPTTSAAMKKTGTPIIAILLVLLSSLGLLARKK